MKPIVFLKKIKNTFMTPVWNNFYTKSHDLVIEQNKKFNKYINYFSKIFWFFPNLEPHKYWRDSSEYERHGYSKYLNEDKFSKILIGEIEKRAKDKRVKILDLCCNIGRCLNSLNHSGFINLYGVDVNKLAIKKMKTIFNKLDETHITHSTAESYLLKTQDNFFDILFTRGATVELIPSTFPLVKEISRVTKKLAILLINEDGHSYPRFWRYEFRKNNMNLIYCKKIDLDTLLVFEKKN